MEEELPSVREVKVIEGVGVSGWVWVEGDNDWKFVIVGNERILEENGGQTSLRFVIDDSKSSFT